MHTLALNRLATIENIEQKIVGALGVMVVLMAFGYIYLINDSIFHVAARKESEEKIATVETDITALVSDYMAISATINLERAKELGFTEVGDKGHFATRNTDTALTLSLQR